MQKRIFFFVAALLLSVGVFAQSDNNSALPNGDVNGDGVVDVADIAAVIGIMRNGGGVAKPPVVVQTGQTPIDNDTLLMQYHCMELFDEGVTRLDTVLINYMSDNTMPEGQTFYLEGGKSYYIQDYVNITKGFTLETNPADIAAGLPRAYVYMGVGYADTEANPHTRQFMLARYANTAEEDYVTLNIGDIVIRNVNFGPQRYYTYSDKYGSGGNSAANPTGNYFINCYSQTMAFSISKLEISNCTFNGFVRGFIRFQGPRSEVIEELTVDNCVFYDCGDFDANGRGYSWFAGSGNNNLANFYKNLNITNNTIIDCPRHALVSENRYLSWPSGTQWNILIENNTFVNFSTKSSNASHGLLIETQYAPSGSNIAVRKNLFVFTNKGYSDLRNLYMKGMRVDNQSVSYDIRDNYSTYIPAWGNFLASNNPNTTLVDGMFSARAFSDATYGAGFNNGSSNLGGMDQLRIKFGDNRNVNETDAVGYQLSADELFQDPQPLGAWRSSSDFDANMHRHNIDGFYYRRDARVLQHPIVTQKIGDQRWATGKAWK